MNKKSIGKNYLYNLIYQILVMILPLITTPYISRVLGAGNIGAYSFTQSITYYFILFGTLGMNLYGQREVAYVQDDSSKRSKIFWEILIIRLITHTISLVVFCFTFCNHEKYGLLFIIQIIDIIASAIDLSWLFQGLEDFKKLVTRNIIVKLATVICIFMFVKDSSDIYFYVLCYSISIIVGNLLMIVYLPKLINKVKINKLNFIKHIKPCLILFLPQIATSIYNVLDKTMIGTITKIEEEVAYYEQAQKFVKVFLAFLTSIGTVMLPRIAFVFSKKDYASIQTYMKKSFRYAFFLGVPLLLGMIATSTHFVPWFYGPGFDRVTPNIIIISPIILLVGLSNVIGVQYLLPIGRQKDYIISVVCGSISNIILNAIFIPKLLSIGAAVATVLAETIVLVVQMFFTRKEFKYVDIFKCSLKYLLAGIVMFLFISLPYTNFTHSIITSLIQVITGVFVYLVILIILKEEIVSNVINKIRRKKNV